jgi:hypothetical protein
MHSAPSVTYPVGRSRLAGWLCLAAWLLGASVVALWAWQAGEPGWRQALALAALAAAGLWSLRRWVQSPAGELAWDGRAWNWAGGGTVAVCLDLQSLVLLRWQGEAGSAQWLWLERSLSPGRWDALRRAVYSRAIPDALQGAEPPAAKP